MRVAIPVDEDGFIERVLEDARRAILFDIEEDEILSEETIEFPSSTAAEVFVSREIDTILCANMDIPAMVALSGNNIEIVGGAKGKAKHALREWLDGTLEQSDMVCAGSVGGCSGDCSHCHQEN